MTSELPSDIKKNDTELTKDTPLTQDIPPEREPVGQPESAPQDTAPAPDAPLPPSVKLYKPELSAHSTGSFSLLGDKHKNTDAIPPFPAAAAAADAEALLQAGEPKPDPLMSAAPPAAPELDEDAEPLPAIFAGLPKRAKPSDPLDFSLREELYTARSTVYGLFDDFFSEEQPESEEGEPEESEETEGEEEQAAEQPPEDRVDVDELLDFIEEIEFAEMRPEPLREVRYSDSVYTSDPYNTTFNSPGAPADRPAEFSLAPSFTFEEK